MLGHHRCDMGVMVLHLDDRKGVAIRPLGREVARVEIGGDRLWFDPEEFDEVVDGPAEGVERLEILHVADVLAHEAVAPRCKAERRLQLATGRQDRRHVKRKRDRERRVSA